MYAPAGVRAGTQDKERTPPVLYMHPEKLSDTSTFRFACRCCGTCCKSGLDIFLNPLDVWNIRNTLKKTTQELAGDCIVMETRPEYGPFPFCFINMKEGYCPFLHDRLCSIHHARPAACRFFPVVHFYEGRRESAFAISDDVDDCPGRKEEKEHILTGWLAVNSFFSYKDIIDFLPELQEKLPEKLDDKNLLRLFATLYDFDTVDDFPYSGIFPEGEKDGQRAVRWIIQRVRQILREM